MLTIEGSRSPDSLRSVSVAVALSEEVAGTRFSVDRVDDEVECHLSVAEINVFS